MLKYTVLVVWKSASPSSKVVKIITVDEIAIRLVDISARNYQLVVLKLTPTGQIAAQALRH